MSAVGVEIDDAGFERAVTEAETPLLVDFWAPWCVPCRALAPRVREFADANPGRIAVASVNVEESPETARRHDVLSLPTLILFRDGRPVERLHGAVSARSLRRTLTPHLEGTT